MAVAFGAQAFDDDDVLWSLEGAVFAAMFGVWLMNETFGARDAVGALLVMGAVALTVLVPRNVEASAEAGR